MRNRNQADLITDYLVTFITDEEGLQIYYNDEVSDLYPCILLTKLRSGESADISIRFNLRSDRNREEFNQDFIDHQSQSLVTYFAVKEKLLQCDDYGGCYIDETGDLNI